MTLNTKIFILNKIDPEEVYEFCNNLLGVRKNDLPTEVNREDDKIHNRIAQGLPAILWVGFNQDGSPIKGSTEYGFAEPESYYIKVSFDTGYGYSGENGEHCDALHGKYILALEKWLSARDMHLAWQNEYTGELSYDSQNLKQFMGEYFYNAAKKELRGESGVTKSITTEDETTTWASFPIHESFVISSHTHDVLHAKAQTEYFGGFLELALGRYPEGIGPGTVLSREDALALAEFIQDTLA